MMMRRTMLFALALVSISAGPCGAAGWTTVVTDQPDGSRAAGLIGTEGDDESRGLVIACARGMPAQITIVSTPSSAYSAGPGSRAAISLAGIEVIGELVRNDSQGVSVVADIPGVQDVLARLAESTSPVEVAVNSGAMTARIAIPTSGLEGAIRDLKDACVLE